MSLLEMVGLGPKCYFCRGRIPYNVVEKYLKTADGRHKRACPGCYNTMRPMQERNPDIKWRGKHRKH